MDLKMGVPGPGGHGQGWTDGSGRCGHVEVALCEGNGEAEGLANGGDRQCAWCWRCLGVGSLGGGCTGKGGHHEGRWAWGRNSAASWVAALGAQQLVPADEGLPGALALLFFTHQQI